MTIKCYNCGGDVIISEGSRMGLCSACMAEIPIPEDVPEITGSYSEANHWLSEKEFEKAEEEFHNILILHPLESAACWGAAISEYGIEYVTDPASGEHIPTLHRLSEQYFTENQYYKQAIACAVDSDTRAFYQEQGNRIDEIQSQSLAISGKEEPYDIFICYKQTEAGEKRTADSRIAGDYYKELTRRGYRVFFAEKTLVSGEEYEPRIFSALQSARLMIAIASKPEYYTAVWVQNEWSRYLALLDQPVGEAAGKQGGARRLLVPMYRNMTRGELPPGLQKQPEYVDMGSLADPRQALFHIVASHFDVESKVEAEDVSRIRREVGMHEKVTMHTSSEKYVTRAVIAMANGSFQEARRVLELSLEEEETPEAYWGLMMCDLELPGSEALNHYKGDLEENAFYQKAIAVAGQEKRARYQAVAAACLENESWAEKVEENRERQHELGRKAEAEIWNSDTALASFKEYREERAWGLFRHREIKDTEESNRMECMLMVFLLTASWLPFLYERTNLLKTAFALVVVTVVCGLVCYGTMGAVLKHFLGKGGRMVILLILTVLYVIGMSDFRHAMLLGLLTVSGLYGLFFVIRRLTVGFSLGYKRRELAERKKNREKLGARMRQEVWEYLDREMDPCRGYYNSPQEYEQVLKIYAEEIGAAIDGKIKELYEPG